MNVDPPPGIEISDGQSGLGRSRSYRLPPRNMPSVNLTAYAGLFTAAFLAGIPVGFSILIWSFTSGAQLYYRLLAASLPLALFGAFLFPAAGYLLARVLVLHWGRLEIVCQPRSLLVVHRWGPVQWTRRFAIADLKGFRVNTDRPFDPNDPAFSQQISRIGKLVADFTRNRSYTVCWGYPVEWLEQLGEELIARITESSATASKLMPLAMEDADPSAIVDREHQPSNSNAVLTQEDDGLVVVLPSLGSWRSEYLPLICVSLGWNALMVFFGLVFLPALFSGAAVWVDDDEKRSQLSIWLGLLLLTPFFALGLGLIALWRRLALRSARIKLDTKALHVTEQGTFRTFTASTDRDQIQSIRVISRAYEQEGKPQTKWQHFLFVELLSDSGWSILHSRNKSELEWLATTLNKELGLPLN